MNIYIDSKRYDASRRRGQKRAGRTQTLMRLEREDRRTVGSKASGESVQPGPTKNEMGREG